MRILIRTSKWAIWSRRFGGFALPLVIIAVFLHRSKSIDTETFVIVLGVATILGFLAALTGLVAMGRLWNSGDKGWARAGMGLLSGIILLGPLGAAFILSLSNPRTTDVWTDSVNPPTLIVASGLPQDDALDYDLIAAKFPNLSSRAYALEPTEAFTLIEALMSDNEWDVRVRRTPDTRGRPGQLNATTMSLFGFVDEISVRVEATQAGTLVAMRSASLYGWHDIGANARRVEQFLLALEIAASDFIADHPTNS